MIRLNSPTGLGCNRFTARFATVQILAPTNTAAKIKAPPKDRCVNLPTMPAPQPCHWPITQLPGLSSQEQTQLQSIGIHTTFELLRHTRTPEQRQKLAQTVDVRPQIIHKWATLADLARVPEVGCQYCGLLLHAGIASVGQLAQCQPPALQKQVFRLHQVLLQRRDLCPSLGLVQRWIAQAKQLRP